MKHIPSNRNQQKLKLLLARSHQTFMKVKNQSRNQKINKKFFRMLSRQMLPIKSLQNNPTPQKQLKPNNPNSQRPIMIAQSKHNRKINNEANRRKSPQFLQTKLKHIKLNDAYRKQRYAHKRNKIGKKKYI